MSSVECPAPVTETASSDAMVRERLAIVDVTTLKDADRAITVMNATRGVKTGRGREGR